MKNLKITILSAVVLTVSLLVPASALAHCDGLDGPVVMAARKALDTGDVKLVLLWVQKTDEAQIKEAFKKTLAVRNLNHQARELTDMYFYETLVRIHRAGEGFRYTGLKPAGRDLGPAIPAGDKAIETGSADALLELLTGKMREGIHARFHEVVARRKYAKDDVAAGREYVKAYVEYIHYIEQLYESAKGPVEGHAHEAADAHQH